MIPRLTGLNVPLNRPASSRLTSIKVDTRRDRRRLYEDDSVKGIIIYDQTTAPTDYDVPLIASLS